MTAASSSPHPRHLLIRLQRDWDRLVADRQFLAAARSWPLDGIAIDSLDDLLTASGLGRRGHSAEADAVLGELLRLAAGDVLAARVVLQRLLPGLAAIAKRRSGTFRGQVDALGDLLCAAWSVIRTFDVDRPRRFLVVSLLRACQFQAFERVDGDGGIDVLAPHELDLPIEDPKLDGFSELVGVLVEARDSGLAAADVTLLARLATAETYGQVAAERSVTTRTVRNHRHLAVHRVRRLVLAA